MTSCHFFFVVLPEILDILLSLPSAEQLEAGDLDLDALTKILMEGLIDESQRNEILQLTGDSAVLMIECLDKVSVSEPHS